MRTSIGNWRKPRIKDASYFINIYLTNPIQVLNLYDFFFFFLCPSTNIFDINIKSMLVLGPRGKDRKYPRDKAKIGNPKINRRCPSLTANRTLTDWMEITLGPSIQHIPLGVYRTGVSALWIVPWIWGLFLIQLCNINPIQITVKNEKKYSNGFRHFTK